MTPVQFHFVLPDGSPFINAPFEVQLAAAAYNSHDDGVLVPRLLTATTDADGKALMHLWPSTTIYHVTVTDPSSDAGLHYKFIVPEVSAGTTVQLQDIVVDAPMSGVSYDDAALLVIQDAKANSRASELAAAASASASAASAATAAARAADVGTYFSEVDAARVAAAASAASAASSAGSAQGAAGDASSHASTAQSAAVEAAQSASDAAASVAAGVSDIAASVTLSNGNASAAAASQLAAASSASAAAASAATAVAAAASISGSGGGGSAIPFVFQSDSHDVGATVTAVMNPGWSVGSYQWLRNGVPIEGATNSSYQISAADSETQITLHVTDLVYAPTGFTVPKYVSPAWDDTAVFNDSSIWED